MTPKIFPRSGQRSTTGRRRRRPNPSPNGPETELFSGTLFKCRTRPICDASKNRPKGFGLRIFSSFRKKYPKINPSRSPSRPKARDLGLSRPAETQPRDRHPVHKEFRRDRGTFTDLGRGLRQILSRDLHQSDLGPPPNHFQGTPSQGGAGETRWRDLHPGLLPAEPGRGTATRELLPAKLSRGTVLYRPLSCRIPSRDPNLSHVKHPHAELHRGTLT